MDKPRVNWAVLQKGTGAVRAAAKEARERQESIGKKQTEDEVKKWYKDIISAYEKAQDEHMPTYQSTGTRKNTGES